MRISDWSSDVCSSDLCVQFGSDRLIAEMPFKTFFIDELAQVGFKVSDVHVMSPFLISMDQSSSQALQRTRIQPSLVASRPDAPHRSQQNLLASSVALTAWRIAAAAASGAWPTR